MKEEYMEKMAKVYKNCVAPSHYLAVMFNDNNAKDIFKYGIHNSEEKLYWEDYSNSAEENTHPQFWRHTRGHWSLQEGIVDSDASYFEWLSSKEHVAVMHTQHLASLHKTYPHTKRGNFVVNNTSFQSENSLANNIVPTIWDSNSSCAADGMQISGHCKHIKSGGRMHDGVEDMMVDCIIAVQPPRAGGNPWFAKVISINKEQQLVEVKWLNLLNHGKKYYYTGDVQATVHMESIICNGVYT